MHYDVIVNMYYDAYMHHNYYAVIYVIFSRPFLIDTMYNKQIGSEILINFNSCTDGILYNMDIILFN